MLLRMRDGGYCFRNSKQVGEDGVRDVSFYVYEVIGHRLPRNAPRVRKRPLVG